MACIRLRNHSPKPDATSVDFREAAQPKFDDHALHIRQDYVTFPKHFRARPNLASCFGLQCPTPSALLEKRHQQSQQCRVLAQPAQRHSQSGLHFRHSSSKSTLVPATLLSAAIPAAEHPASAPVMWSRTRLAPQPAKAVLSLTPPTSTSQPARCMP